jgi:hypothetical protein
LAAAILGLGATTIDEALLDLGPKGAGFAFDLRESIEKGFQLCW